METQPAKQASEPFYDIGKVTSHLESFKSISLRFRVLQSSSGPGL